MEVEFQCEINFNNTLKEVILIEELANLFADNPEEVKYYKALNKTAVLLLSSKFEVFLEECVAEFIDTINSLRINKNKISSYLKVKHSTIIIENLLQIYKHDRKVDKVAEELKKLAECWDDKEESIILNINNKFNYGSHGSNEVIELFRNIDIPNVFEVVRVTRSSDSMLSDEEILVDFKGKLNSFINIRNGITHQDQTTNLTHKDIKDYRELFAMFSLQLCNLLKTVINDNFRIHAEDEESNQDMAPIHA
ncbi:HEPN domain-containing protein [Lysinibacillus endophyticus]|uniref:MAE_28990/MAE_18760 family HEPN-like nuclease n=1 Tax=Ureibacillus endophyticus TaxID=1978490 RepID=UPI003136BDD1